VDDPQAGERLAGAGHSGQEDEDAAALLPGRNDQLEDARRG